MKLSNKITLSIAIAMALGFGGIGAYTMNTMNELAHKSGEQLAELTKNSLEDRVMRQAGTTASLVDTVYQGLEINAQSTWKHFNSVMPKEQMTEVGPKVETAGKELPALLMGDSPINGNFKNIDKYTQTTGNVATVFVRDGDDFYRVTTSLKKEDGTRAYGTMLDRNHPAYQLLLKGQSYTGFATLFGKDYMTHYEPMTNGEGKVIGVSFIGYDASKEIAQMKQTISKVKVGTTGYIFILDSKGTLKLHPKSEGKNVMDRKDINGLEYFKEMVEKSTKEPQKLYYTRADKEGEQARAKVSGFAKTNNGYTIVASSYPEEFTGEYDKAQANLEVHISSVMNQLMLLLGGAGLLLAGVAYGLVRRETKPLTDLSNTMVKVAQTGNFDTVRFDGKVSDEIASVQHSFNVMLSNIRGSIDDSQKVLKAIATNKTPEIEGAIALSTNAKGTMLEMHQGVITAANSVLNSGKLIDATMQKISMGDLSIGENDRQSVKDAVMSIKQMNPPTS